jgi:acetoacetyl-CoA synthetase
MASPARLFSRPSQEDIDSSELEKFRLRISRTRNLDLKDYWEIHSWSVREPAAFWDEIWDHFGIIGIRGPNGVISVSLFCVDPQC